MILAKSTERKNYNTEMTFFVSEMLWRENKTSREWSKVTPADFGTKNSVNHWRVSLKIFEKFSSQCTQKLLAAPFLYLWKSLVFLMFSGGAYLSGAEISMSPRVEDTDNQKLLKIFSKHEARL